MSRWGTWAILMVAVYALSAVNVARPALAHEPIDIVVGDWTPLIDHSVAGHGPVAERAAFVFGRAGWQVRWSFTTWEEVYEQVRTGKVAASVGFFKTPDRERDVDFSERPIGVASSVVFYRKNRFAGRLQVETLEELGRLGLIIGAVRAYWMVPELERLNANLRLVDHESELWTDLAQGRVDLVVSENTVGYHNLTRLLGKDAAREFSRTLPVKTDRLYVIFSRHHPQAAALRKAWEAGAAPLVDGWVNESVRSAP